MKLPFFRPPDPRIASYVAETPRRIGKSIPVDDLTFVILDSETTGFSVATDRILSIAAMPVRHGRAVVGELKSWIIYHADALVTPAMQVHTILPSESSLGSPEPEVLEELCQMLTGVVFVGHHVGFDAAMVNSAMIRYFGSGLRNPLIDTATMAMLGLEAFRRSGYANQRSPGLDEVCSHLGLPLWERHTADGDAFATAQLFLMLCARLKLKLGRNLILGDLPVIHGPG